MAHAPGTIIALANVAGPHGVHGWVKLHPEPGNPGMLLGISAWFMRARQAAWTPVEVAGSRLAHDRVLARFADIDDRDAAQALTGHEVGARRADMPAPPAGTHYWCDLIGLQAHGAGGVVLGRVVRMLSSPAHDLAEVDDGEGTVRLIPFKAPVVERVDLEGGCLHTSWRADD